MYNSILYILYVYVLYSTTYMKNTIHMLAPKNNVLSGLFRLLFPYERLLFAQNTIKKKGCIVCTCIYPIHSNAKWKEGFFPIPGTLYPLIFAKTRLHSVPARQQCQDRFSVIDVIRFVGHGASACCWMHTATSKKNTHIPFGSSTYIYLFFFSCNSPAGYSVTMSSAQQ